MLNDVLAYTEVAAWGVQLGISPLYSRWIVSFIEGVCALLKGYLKLFQWILPRILENNYINDNHMNDKSFSISTVYHFVKDCLLLSLLPAIGMKESKLWKKNLETLFSLVSLNYEIAGAGEQLGNSKD